MKNQYLLILIPIFLMVSYIVGLWSSSIKYSEIRLAGYKEATIKIWYESLQKDGSLVPVSEEDGGGHFVIMEKSVPLREIIARLKKYGSADIYISEEESVEVVLKNRDYFSRSFKEVFKDSLSEYE